MSYDLLKVGELQQLLVSRNLSTKGRKAELVARLEAADHSTPSVLRQNGISEMNEPNTTTHSVSSIALCTPASHMCGADGLLDESPNISSTAETFSAVYSMLPISTAPAPHEASTPSNATDGIGTAVDNTPITTRDISKLTEEERLLLRKQKFESCAGPNADKPVSEVEKKLQRAKRFGILTAEVEAEKKAARAARFGVSSETPTKLKTSSQRIQPLVVDEDELSKRAKRAERFNIVQEDEKRAERAKRFGLPSAEKEAGEIVSGDPADFTPTAFTKKPFPETGPESWNAKLAARQLRFGVISKQQKRRLQRAE